LVQALRSNNASLSDRGVDRRVTTSDNESRIESTPRGGRRIRQSKDDASLVVRGDGRRIVQPRPIQSGCDARQNRAKLSGGVAHG